VLAYVTGDSADTKAASPDGRHDTVAVAKPYRLLREIDSVYVPGGAAKTHRARVPLTDRAAQEPKLFGEVFFATHEEHLSVIEIARRMIESFGRGRLNHVDWPDERKRIEIDDVRISSELLRSKMGWKPRYDFGEGLERTKQVLLSEGKNK
jgi:hypothetical protein